MNDRDDGSDRLEPTEEDYGLVPVEPGLVPDDEETPQFPATPGELPEPEPQRFQVSIAELLLVMVGASLLMSVLGLLPQQYAIQNFAGLAGLGVLLSMIVLAVLRPTRPVVYLGWWIMLALYVLACIAAVIKG